ncbi:MAG TPA: SDR family oxidoreductase [Devosia sp.]|nr:SDR family oxidoreductase [Devosia sp.]
MSTQKTALITGATSGIGRACALGLARAGYNIVVSGRRGGRLKETLEMSGADEANTLGVVGDVTEEASVMNMFAEAKEKFGRIDVVFNNAGRFLPAARIDDTSLETFQEGINVNLVGAFLVAREAFRHMRDQSPQGGRIINNGSISAYVPRPNAVPYNTSKHAISGLTKSISLEGRNVNIACSQIDIGNAATDMTAKMETGMLQANGTIAPEPTFDVEHVVDAVIYIAGLPLNANVQFMTVMATTMPYVGRG